MNKELTCNFCQKSFSTTSNLEKHKRTTKRCFSKNFNSIENIKKYDCNFCSKPFTSKQRLNYHLSNACKVQKEKKILRDENNFLKEKIKYLEKKDIQEEKVEKKDIKIEENEIKENYIYCLIEREFLKSEEPIYKVGKSTNLFRRFRNYPKGSKIVFFSEVNDCHLAEKELLKVLNSHEKIVKASDIGNEYYKSKLADILQVLVNTVLLYNKQN
jgi:hypothetical protein